MKSTLSKTNIPIISYLSLGTNLGNRENNLITAIRLLHTIRGVTVLRESQIYETSPVKTIAQPWFLNKVIEVRTTLTPQRLLKLCQKIEVQMGRTKSQHWGPRIIDIDILLYGNQVIEDEDLLIPHPSMHLRKFVLAPLLELYPDFIHPSNNMAITELIKKFDKTQIVNKFSTVS